MLWVPFYREQSFIRIKDEKPFILRQRYSARERDRKKIKALHTPIPILPMHHPTPSTPGQNKRKKKIHLNPTMVANVLQSIILMHILLFLCNFPLSIIILNKICNFPFSQTTLSFTTIISFPFS